MGIAGSRVARKDGSTLPARPAPAQRRAHRPSWAAVGIDASLTAISVVSTGYDGNTQTMRGPFWAERRWMPETDYFTRLSQATRSNDLVDYVLRDIWKLEPDNIFVAIEEPWYYGAVKMSQSGYLKQQAEICGCVKGSLARYGYLNMHEINNSSWHKTLRDEGALFVKATQGSTSAEKVAIKLANKFVVKQWAMQAFGLPDFPDLVASKSGAKIPRPDSGYGSNAKAVQPSDVYDAAACCAWAVDNLVEKAIREV